MSSPLDGRLYAQVKREAKRKFERYPSLYASSWIVREYKKRGGRYGGSKRPSTRQGISRWYGEKWVDVTAYLKQNKYVACGSAIRKNKACRPLKRVSASTPITIPELLKVHSKATLMRLARKKEKDMRGRVYWKTGRFTPSSSSSSEKKLRGGKTPATGTVCYLTPATGTKKKYRVVIFKNGKKVKTVMFGAKGYSDYTLHKDRKRRERYDRRHRKNETWTASGVTTAGFWSKWLLWNKTSIRASILDMQRRFRLRILRRAAPAS